MEVGEIFWGDWWQSGNHDPNLGSDLKMTSRFLERYF